MALSFRDKNTSCYENIKEVIIMINAFKEAGLYDKNVFIDADVKEQLRKVIYQAKIAYEELTSKHDDEDDDVLTVSWFTTLVNVMVEEGMIEDQGEA